MRQLIFMVFIRVLNIYIYIIPWWGLACDGFAAGLTLLGVQAAEALEAVRAVVSGGEVLTRQLRLTAGAHETLLMPRLVPVSHAPFSQGLEKRDRSEVRSLLISSPVHIPVDAGLMATRLSFMVPLAVFHLSAWGDSPVSWWLHWPFYSACSAGRTCPRSR